LHWILLPTRNVQQNAALRYYIPQARSTFWLLKPASEHEHARLLPRLCCYLVIHIETCYIHYSCVTSICDLFTDSPSYIQTK
jgi:hypothetical protein